jgi:cytidylate kinase
MRKINIAIDGYSACGKSSTAKKVAEILNYTYVDSGAMYRAVTFYFLNHKVDIQSVSEVEIALQNINIKFKNINHKQHIFLNQIDVSEEIRENIVNQFVSDVSKISVVRKKLVLIQQDIAKQKAVVMDGRDIGSVVLPNAELKFFMIADIDIRTKRRMQELMLEDTIENFNQIKQNLLLRDKIDSTRNDSPLTKVEEAIEIDTSYITLQYQIDFIVQKAKEIIFEN